VQLKDIVLAEGASTTSSWQDQFHLYGTFAPIASWDLLYKAVKASEKLKTKVVVGNVLSEDVFYSEDPENVRKWQNLGIICLEMESAALYMNAAKLGKNALAMFSISDEILTGKCLSSKDREVGFGKMMELALELA
jgi:purine-nucleoside phosphorylase